MLLRNLTDEECKELLVARYRCRSVPAWFCEILPGLTLVDLGLWRRSAWVRRLKGASNDENADVVKS